MRKLFFIAVFAALMLIPSSPVLAQGGWLQNGSSIYYNNGPVGIGTTTPQSLLHISGAAGVSTLTFDSPGVQRFRFGTIGGIINWGALIINAKYNSGWFLDDTATNGWFVKLDGRGGNAESIFNGFWLYRIPSGAGAHTDEAPLFGVTNGSAFIAQKLGIGITAGSSPDSNLQVVGTVHVTSDVTIDGNVAAKYQDVAEWVETSETLAAGTVVVVDPSGNNIVTASNRAYQTSVAGVVSAQPGIILGVGADNKAKIATTGRVRVRVDATRAPIRPGDLLVTSDETGIAMRSEPVDIAGVKMHRPGTILGKALEPLASGKGDVLVLLSLQ